MSNQSTRRYDVIVVGGGPGGALTAMMLARRGRRVALVDRDLFPRFAIGESSTPIASRALEQIAADHGLPELLPLTRWGRWGPKSSEGRGARRGLDVTGGLKRGFTYYDHRPASSGERTIAETIWPSRPRERLLVAASACDADGDTHWVRAEVDTYLIDVCRRHGVDVRLGWQLDRIERSASQGWDVHLRELDGDVELLSCDTLVDASGRSGAVVQCLGYRDATASLRTRTAACFTHLIGTSEPDVIDVDRLPYHPQNAAVHHLLHDGWVWQLPMSDGRMSVGRIWHPTSRSSTSPTLTAKWQKRQTCEVDDLVGNLDVQQYSAMRNWLAMARLAAVPHRWIHATRVQHRWHSNQPMTLSMLALPTTLATLDPLHSTGLAHAITGAQRVSDLIVQGESATVARYARQVQCEIELLDRVISLAYRVWSRTELLFDALMLYFSLAIGDEEERIAGGFDPNRSTWRASDPRIVQATGEAESLILSALISHCPIDRRQFCIALGRICQVPLACREDNLYAYTFA